MNTGLSAAGRAGVWIGILSVMIYLFEVSILLAKKTNAAGLRVLRGRNHILGGKIILAVSFVHGILSVFRELRGLSRPALKGAVIFSGWCVWGALLLLLSSWLFRKRMGNWKRSHRRLAILMTAFLAVHLLLNCAMHRI